MGAFAWAPFLVGDGFGVLKDTDSQSMQMEKHPKIIEARTGKQQQIRKQVGLSSMRYSVTSPTRKDMEGYWGNWRGLKNYPGEGGPMTLL